jgi:hypothetical protein
MSKHVYHRRIYEKHYGPIPKDSHGRSYEIHHIDGNHKNNSIENLKLVTIQEHYDIHYAQGDYGACLIMSDRMNVSPEEKSRLASLHTKRMLETGVHPFLRPNFQRNTAIKMTKEGRNPFSGGGIQRRSNQKRLTNGTHHLIGNTFAKDLIAQGKHPTQKKWVCAHCNKSGTGSSNYNRWHGDKCKEINIGT